MEELLMDPILINRFTTSQGAPSNWGQAVELRIMNQRKTCLNENAYDKFKMKNVK